jgi:hypothetical protein
MVRMDWRRYNDMQVMVPLSFVQVMDPIMALSLEQIVTAKKVGKKKAALERSLVLFMRLVVTKSLHPFGHFFSRLPPTRCVRFRRHRTLASKSVPCHIWCGPIKGY